MSEALQPEERAQRPLFDRTLQRIGHLWRELAHGRAGSRVRVWAKLGKEDERDLRRLMVASVEPHLSELAARTRAAELGYTYLNLDRAGRRRFLEILTETLDLDRAHLFEVAQRFLESDARVSYRDVQQAAWPPRVRFLKMLNSLPEGFKFLVDLRRELLSFLADAPGLKALDHDLRTLFDFWFDVSLLTFERITWDSPASLLEKLIAYEAVHKVRSWLDLKNRLGADRRCYAFFHPKIPSEPLIFVQVALTEAPSDNIRVLLDEAAPLQEPLKATTAVFYSISSTQAGLQGISFGTFLLKQVIDDLSRQLPRLKTFVTLSPLPGFRRWFLDALSGEGALLEPAERVRLEAVARSREVPGLAALFEQPDWWHDDTVSEALRDPLLRACAGYLLTARREDGRPFDPVARFHLNNGAQVERINWLADTSPEGLEQSLGLMVNYLYKPDRIEANQERLAHEGKVTASPAVRRLVRA